MSGEESERDQMWLTDDELLYLNWDILKGTQAVILIKKDVSQYKT